MLLFYCLVAKLCLTLCDPMKCSTPGFPIFHYLLEFGRTDAEAEAPILCPPDVKNRLIGKDPDVGKIEGRMRKDDRG